MKKRLKGEEPKKLMVRIGQRVRFLIENTSFRGTVVKNGRVRRLDKKNGLVLIEYNGEWYLIGQNLLIQVANKRIGSAG